MRLRIPIRIPVSLSIALLAITVVRADTADNVFHGGAQRYLTNNIPGALEVVTNGLQRFPDDEKLKKLYELLNQKQQQQQQQNQQDQKDQQQDQQKQDEQSKNDQQKKDEQQKQQEAQNKKDQEKKDQQHAKSGDKSKEKPEDKTGQPQQVGSEAVIGCAEGRRAGFGLPTSGRAEEQDQASERLVMEGERTRSLRLLRKKPRLMPWL